MNVICHQYIGVDGAVKIGSRFLQPLEVAVVILLGEKAGLSIDSALHEVLRIAWGFIRGRRGIIDFEFEWALC